MTLTNLYVNFLLALPLLWINGILGKWKLHSYGVFGYSMFGFEDISERNFFGNFFQMVIHPPIYLAVVCWILQALSLEYIIPYLWLLIPFYWLLRVAYSVWGDCFAFTNWKIQLVAFLFSIILGEGTLFCIICPLIDSSKSVMIDIISFRDAFWFAVLAYLAKWVWDYSKSVLVGEELFPSQKKNKVIIRRYTKYRIRYEKYINGFFDREFSFASEKQKQHFMCLVYAIMIYETHNRPLWARIIEYCVKFFCPGRIMSLGVMQVQTNTMIGDKTSVYYAIKKMYAAFSTAVMVEKLSATISDYNPGQAYYNQVVCIYDEIWKHLGLQRLGYQRVEVTECNMVCKSQTK